MPDCLILNKDGNPLSLMPLSVVSWQTAIRLLTTGKVRMVKEHAEWIVNSPSISMNVPSVLITSDYIKWNRHIKYNRNNVLLRDDYTCQYCGATGVELTIDHVIPKVLGGEDSWTNLVTACVKCNNKKGNKTPEQAGMKLLNKPRKVHRIHTLQKFLDSPIEEWRPFLFMD